MNNGNQSFGDRKTQEASIAERNHGITSIDDGRVPIPPSVTLNGQVDSLEDLIMSIGSQLGEIKVGLERIKFCAGVYEKTEGEVYNKPEGSLTDRLANKLNELSQIRDFVNAINRHLNEII